MELLVVDMKQVEPWVRQVGLAHWEPEQLLDSVLLLVLRLPRMLRWSVKLRGTELVQLRMKVYL